MKTKIIYRARVHDTTKRLNGGDWFLVKTRSNPNGEWGVKANAQDALDRATENNADLAGHVVEEKITVPQPLHWQDWLHGNVVDPKSVPTQYRDDYANTLKRAATAARAYGEPIQVNSSFRFRAEQQRLYDLYLSGQGALAAPPGHSDHERGLALDIQNARTNAKLIRQLRRQKMMDIVPSENWHCVNMARKNA